MTSIAYLYFVPFVKCYNYEEWGLRRCELKSCLYHNHCDDDDDDDGDDDLKDEDADDENVDADAADIMLIVVVNDNDD